MARRRLLSTPIWRCASIIFLLGYAASPSMAEGNLDSTNAPSTSTTLSLADAIAMATAKSPAVYAAQQAWAEAEARVDQARAQTRVTLSFNSTASESNAAVATPPPDHETFGSIVNSITMPVPLGRRPTLAVAQAEAQAAAAKAQFTAAERTQTLAVINAYFDLLKKQSQLVDAQLNLDQAQRQLDDASLRNKAGDVPELDVIRAQVPVAQAEAGVVQAQNAIDIAGEALNAAIGRQISTPVIVTTPSTETGTQSLDDVERLAVEGSGDIAAARSTITAQQVALESAKHWRDPALSLQASDTRGGDVTSFSHQDTIQASITIPLTDGGLVHGQRDEATAAINQAGAQLATSILTVQASAASAYHNAVTTRKLADSAKAALDIAQTAYEKTAHGYHSGLFPLTDLLNAQTSLAQTRSTYTQALYDAGAAAATLNEIIGVDNAGRTGTPIPR